MTKATAKANKPAPLTSDEVQIANVLAKAVLEKKARDVVILDLRNLIDYADIFILCTATNRRQVQAIAAGLRKAGREQLQMEHKGIEGFEAARWVLVDFGSVVVHVFDEPMRGFYDLDTLWGDAPRLPVPDAPPISAEEADEDPLFRV
jgi:ribosome-associated protein